MRSKRSEKLKSQFRPNIFDLQWEVVRRNPQYRKDYQALKENPELAKKPLGSVRNALAGGPPWFKDRWMALAYKFNLSKAVDPLHSWEKFKVPPTYKTPNLKALEGGIFLPDDTTYSPVQHFSFKVRRAKGEDYTREEDLLYWNKYRDRYLWLRVDPTANLPAINKDISQRVKKFRKGLDTKNKIRERIAWLTVVDKIEKHNPLPTRATFRKAYPKADFEGIRRRLKDYARGKILIEKLLSDPLKPLSKREIYAYLKTHKLITPRSK